MNGHCLIMMLGMQRQIMALWENPNTFGIPSDTDRGCINHMCCHIAVGILDRCSPLRLHWLVVHFDVKVEECYDPLSWILITVPQLLINNVQDTVILSWEYFHNLATAPPSCNRCLRHFV